MIVIRPVAIHFSLRKELHVINQLDVTIIIHRLHMDLFVWGIITSSFLTLIAALADQLKLNVKRVMDFELTRHLYFLFILLSIIIFKY